MEAPGIPDIHLLRGVPRSLHHSRERKHTPKAQREGLSWGGLGGFFPRTTSLFSPVRMEAVGKSRSMCRERICQSSTGLVFSPLYLNKPPAHPSRAANERTPEKTLSFIYLFLILLKDTGCFAALAPVH